MNFEFDENIQNLLCAIGQFSVSRTRDAKLEGKVGMGKKGNCYPFNLRANFCQIPLVLSPRARAHTQTTIVIGRNEHTS